MKGFADHTDDVIRRLGAAAERGMTRIGMDVEKSYKENVRSTLNNTGTARGDLLNSTGHIVDKRGMQSAVTIGNGKVYARIHEFGGVIKAKNGDYLKFRLPDGSFVQVKQVTIPARPTLRPALMAHSDRPPKLMAEEMMRA